MDYQINLNHEQCKLLFEMVEKRIIDIEENIEVERSFGTSIEPRYYESVRTQLETLKELGVQLGRVLKGQILFDNVIETIDELVEASQSQPPSKTNRKLKRYMTVRDMVAYRVYDEYNNGSVQETLTIFTVTKTKDDMVAICDNPQSSADKPPVFNSVEGVLYYLNNRGYIKNNG